MHLAAIAWTRALTTCSSISGALLTMYSNEMGIINHIIVHTKYLYRIPHSHTCIFIVQFVILSSIRMVLYILYRIMNNCTKIQYHLILLYHFSLCIRNLSIIHNTWVIIITFLPNKNHIGSVIPCIFNFYIENLTFE